MQVCYWHFSGRSRWSLNRMQWGTISVDTTPWKPWKLSPPYQLTWAIFRIAFQTSIATACVPAPAKICPSEWMRSNRRYVGIQAERSIWISFPPFYWSSILPWAIWSKDNSNRAGWWNGSRSMNLIKFLNFLKSKKRCTRRPHLK